VDEPHVTGPAQRVDLVVQPDAPVREHPVKRPLAGRKHDSEQSSSAIVLRRLLRICRDLEGAAIA